MSSAAIQIHTTATTPPPVAGMRIRLKARTREWHDKYVSKGDYAAIVRMAIQEARLRGEPETSINRWAVKDAIKKGEGRAVIAQCLDSYFKTKAELQGELP